MKKSKEEPEGCEPTEEVGPDGCDPSPAQTEQKARDMDESPDGSHPKFMEEIQDSYSPEVSQMVVSPDDGLPVPADEASEVDIAPPFTIDHVVCVEDDRVFVEVFAGEMSLEHLETNPSDGLSFPNVARLRNRFAADGTENERELFDPKDTVERWGVLFAIREDPLHGTKELIFVRPLRERCKYYKRQVFANDAQEPDSFGAKIVFRNCMARRSVGGAAMSLRDEAIFACDWRDPPDRQSVEKYLDEPDRAHLRSDAHRKKLPLFRTQ